MLFKDFHYSYRVLLDTEIDIASLKAGVLLLREACAEQKVLIDKALAEKKILNIKYQRIQDFNKFTVSNVPFNKFKVYSSYYLYCCIIVLVTLPLFIV